MSADIEEGVRLWRAMLQAESGSPEQQAASDALDKWAEGATAEDLAVAYDAA